MMMMMVMTMTMKVMMNGHIGADKLLMMEEKEEEMRDGDSVYVILCSPSMTNNVSTITREGTIQHDA